MVSLVQISTSLRVGQPRSRLKPVAYLHRSLVRTTRARVVRLRNDYKALMNTIEKFLHEHFASSDDTDNDAVPSSAPVLPDSQPEVLDEPFAKVNMVAGGSPAESAGLKPGDEIRNFGYVNKSNHDNLRKVAECVQGNEGVR